MLKHLAPFDSVQQPLGQRVAAIERVDLHVTPVRDQGLLLLQTASPPALREVLDQTVGLTLPAARRAAMHDSYVVLWLTPAEWLLQLPASETDPIGATLVRRLASSLSVVTDLSDAFVSVDVGGVGGTEILMTGCSLDLRPEAFPAGHVARTALADVPAILWNPGDADCIRCLVDRGFASHFLAWLEGTTPQ